VVVHELLAAQHAARHLEVDCAWENHAAVHDVLGHQVVEVARAAKERMQRQKVLGHAY